MFCSSISSTPPEN
ncbi:hypothetical protein LINGRAHAP2_LOCUS31631 [Linum grandiflorum]